MMQVRFNDTFIDTSASTLLELLEEHALSSRNGIAVAVNDKVIQRSNWASQQLTEKDVILVITAAAGG